MDSLDKGQGKVSTGDPVKTVTFSFVPVVQRLPTKGILTEEESEALKANPDKRVAVSHERKTMSDGRIFNVKTLFIEDILKGNAGNVTQLETEPQFKSSPEHVILSKTKASPSLSAQAENTPNHITTGTVSMGTAVDKQRGICQWQHHNTPGHTEAGPANTAMLAEDRTSPTDSADLFPTPASSRESILSEDLDKEKSWFSPQLSTVTSPASLSRTVSPCSSVRSGVFTPSVIQVKRHFLAPGSSLINIPETCFSSCESLSSYPRHRPPVTRLSLLTAILRKGRLPVLSPALQRPYTPCWPVNPVTLSFCNACSAASSLASIPLEFSSRFSSSASIDSQPHIHRELNTVPSQFKSNEHNRTCPQTQIKGCTEQICNSGEPRREQAISPPPVMNRTLPRNVPPFFKSVHSVKHEHLGSATAPNSSISQFPEPMHSNSHMLLQEHAHNKRTQLSSPPPCKPSNQQQQSVLQNGTSRSNSSLARLRLLSQHLKSPPVSPPPYQPSQSFITASSARSDTESPLDPWQHPSRVGVSDPGRSCPVSRSATPLQAVNRAQCLSPSRHTPIFSPGWLSPASSRTSTPFRELTTSPSLSLRSTPSPRPGSGISDCSDREGKKRKTHRIKLSYKSLAAIPTNTLLLDQQIIDEEVEKDHNDCDKLDSRAADTHAEMYSPAQLRQQSEELYAAIDEILAYSTPETTKSTTSKTGVQKNNKAKTLGRETKYASLCSLLPSAKQKKPGIIRPMTAIPRLTLKDEAEFCPNPRQFVKQTLQDKKQGENMSFEKARTQVYASLKGKLLREERAPERRPPFSACELHIEEPNEQINHRGKEASTSFVTTEKRIEALETHI
ncbi:muscular LMNA-interacting protein [Cololabis saira]|uniref:muscular LMNA-interacting protein n=1 Tax=Cololabis saira TaxID=129043 RepID=UPI002AD4F010|nr:muscular LMNA-interacting protein [Cololabis saira]